MEWNVLSSLKLPAGFNETLATTLIMSAKLSKVLGLYNLASS